VTVEASRYHIVENLGETKLWQIWRFTTNSPKFYPPIACSICNKLGAGLKFA